MSKHFGHSNFTHKPYSYFERLFQVTELHNNHIVRRCWLGLGPAYNIARMGKIGSVIA
jgi:hypothetical protein